VIGGILGGVNELRRAVDEPERPDHSERRVPVGGADTGDLRQRIEPRSQAEYAAELEQQAVSGWDRPAFGSRMGAPLDGARIPGAPADRSDGSERLETPLDVVRRFEPRRAGLPEVSAADAVAYIDARSGERPWLAAVRGCAPEVQRVFAALDQGGGHGHIRHEGWVTEEMNQRRVAYLEDPAQRDLAKQAQGVDGLKSPEKFHLCRDTSSRIADPDAFATAMAKATEHPDIRAALETPLQAGRRPGAVVLPIDSLLGADGHRYCTGWRLASIGGSVEAAADCRDAWVNARRLDRQSDVPEPRAHPIATFDGGTIVFTFGQNLARDRYEIVTMYPRPSHEHQERGIPRE
jgi:hypothetical protein